MQMEIKTLLSVTASISTILQFLSGTLVCQNIVKKGTTGDISPIPFIVGCLSTSLWLRYGFLIQDRSITLVNTVGATLFLSYVFIFYLYSIKKWALLKQICLCLCVLVTILIYSTGLNGESVEVLQQRIGMICCFVTIIFFASPLSSCMHVIRMKSAESMPYPLILASFIVSCQWYIYGIVIDDYFVQIPNLLGAALSAIQLCLFCIYPSKYKLLDEV